VTSRKNRGILKMATARYKLSQAIFDLPQELRDSQNGSHSQKTLLGHFGIWVHKISNLKTQIEKNF
jgi:hypothetical protein